MERRHILLERTDGVGLVRLNRPDALNALNDALMHELADALDELESDDAIGAIVITGDDKAFAAGADIKEMAEKSSVEMLLSDHVSPAWERVASCRKPVIAAVAGYALGGGCELALMCDFIVAADNARFGQPEINLAILPGIGGTQRLTRMVGKSRAMDMCLTGRMMDAEEADRAGLVTRVYPVDELVESTLKIAASIAEKSRPAVYLTKEAVNRAFETSLSEGLLFERRAFYSAFALEDQKEGMAAFAAKRRPEWKHR